MCKALDDLYNDGIELGIERGIKQGIERGIKQGIERGIEQGIEQGIERGIFQTIIKLVSQGKLTLEEGALELGISADELKAKMA